MNEIFNAWEVTLEDVGGVLLYHGLIKDYDDPLVAIAHDMIVADAVAAAALSYTDFNSQVNGALSEIEDQLIAEKIIIGKTKRFLGVS